jgi:hypothetical protein
MSERLIDRLSMEQIEAIFDVLPLEFLFIDEKDQLQYHNKRDERTIPGLGEYIGKDIRSAHKAESLPLTDKVLENFKNGKKDEWEFWIDGLGIKLLNRFFAVRNKEGKYLGCLEYLHNFTAMEQMAEGKKDSYRRISSDLEALKETEEE